MKPSRTRRFAFIVAGILLIAAMAGPAASFISNNLFAFADLNTNERLAHLHDMFHEAGFDDAPPPTTTTTAPPPTTTTTTIPPTTTTTVAPTTTTTVAPTTTTTAAPAGPCVGVNVAAGSNLSSVASSYVAGTTFCLAAGTYSISTSIPAQTGDKWWGALGAGNTRLSILTGNDTTRFFMNCTCTDQVWRNIVIEKFKGQVIDGTNTQDGLTAGNLDRLLVDNVESRYNWGAGMVAYTGAIYRNSHIHHSHWLGFTGNGPTNVLIENTQISYNNYLGEHNWGWSAGGMKLVHNSNVTLRNNESHHNCGPGLWADNVESGYIYEGNYVHDNFAPGIMHEISKSAIIRNNSVINNARGGAGLAGCGAQTGSSGGESGGILISDSSGVEVYGNTLVGNDGGIVLRDYDRGAGEDSITNVNVHDNDSTYDTGYTGVNSGQAGGTYANGTTHFTNNDYHTPTITGTWFQWTGLKTFTQWKALGHDTTGSID